MVGNNSSNSVGTRSSRRLHHSSSSHQLSLRGGSIISTPICRCENFCVLRTAKTVANYGRKFWGCRNFKGPQDVGCNYFDWFYNEEVNGNSGKEAEIEDFDYKIEEIEMLGAEKNLKIKGGDVKLYDQDMKIAKQKKKIKNMKEEMLSTKNMLKLVCVVCFVCLCLILVLVAVIWSILAP